MKETLFTSSSAEERVFGAAFSLQTGPADQEAQRAYRIERTSQLMERKEPWIVREFNVEQHEMVVADKYLPNGVIAATLMYDCNLGLTDAFRTNGRGTYYKDPLCKDVQFEEAVSVAGIYAQRLKEFLEL